MPDTKKYKKEKTEKILQVSKLLILTAIMAYSFPVNANTDRDQLLEILDEIQSQKSELKNQGLAATQETTNLLLDLEENKTLISANQQNIANLESAILETEQTIENKKKHQGELLSILYMDESSNRSFFALISARSLSDLVKNQVYLKSIKTQIVEMIKEINKESAKLSEAKNLAVAKRTVLETQIDILQNQIGSLKSVVAETESRIKDLEKTSKEVEQQILNLATPIVAKNNRDFINWDTIDFAVQNQMTIHGSGTPHGLGMSQYGAKAMADSGKNYENILTHYYQGTRLDSVNTDDVKIRVKLSASTNGGKIIVTGGDAKVSKNGEINSVSNGSIVPADPGTVVTPASETTRLVVAHKFDRFNTYRGEIHITGNAGNITTINVLPIEDYLRSVVSGEMSASWHKEALKAQAVAARNYAYKNRGSKPDYDLCDTPSCQVYYGTLHEFASTDQAVAETKGKVLKYQGDIITAYYFSSSGGWTENNENVWGGKPIPWLRGVESPGEQSPYNSWKTVVLDKKTLEAYLNSDTDSAVGDLQKIEIVKRGVSGIVMAVKITGSEGEKTVTGQTFKYIINVNLPDGTRDYIKSSLFGIK